MADRAAAEVKILPPVITQITPVAAPAGSSNLELKIEGCCFVPGTVVSFQPSDGIEVIPPSPPNFGFEGTTELRQHINISPVALGGGRQVFVTTPNGVSGGTPPFNLFFIQPRIARIEPTSGSVGTQVTITGGGFGATAAGNIVFFGTTEAEVTVASATQIVTTVPTGLPAGRVPVTVTVAGQTSNTSNFIVTTQEGQRIIKVAQQGGGDFMSVQAAIDDARPGDIVEITDFATYRENLMILTDGITLRAAQGKTPVIDGSTEEGDAILISGAAGVTIERLTIRGVNTTEGYCFGIWIGDGDGITLVSNVITNNDNGICSLESQVIVRNNNVESNHGVGIFFDGSSGEITGNRIRNNDDGDPNEFFDRGIQIADAATDVLIQDNEIIGNGNQGVIIFSSRAKLINNLIANNRAGVVLNSSEETPHQGAQVTIINNTIAANQLVGVCAVSGSNSRSIIVNSIIDGNTDDLKGIAAADVSFSLIRDGTSAGQNNNITDDPGFVNSSSGNFRLQTTSPALDKGSNAAIAGFATDLDSKPRIVDGNRDETAIVDMGAYEVQL